MCVTRTVMAFAVVVVIITGGARDAPGNVHMGKAEIDPYFSLQEIFTDNVYLTEIMALSDRITEITPGAKLRFPFGMHQFEADYHAVFRRYATYRGEDTEDHHAGGTLDLHFGGKISLKIGEQYDKGHDARNESATGFVDVYRKNDLSATAAYQMANRSKVQLEYRKAHYNYMMADFRDRDEVFSAGYVYYRFLPKTSAFIEYDHRTVNYVVPGSLLNSTVDYAWLGVTWEASAKSTGTVKAGRIRKDFESAANPDFASWSLFVDIKHDFTDYTSLYVTAKRDVNETNVLGTAYYVTTGFYSELKHRFISKFSGVARFSLGKDDFSNAVAPSPVVRSDKTTMAGGGLRYAIREWIEAGADYAERKRGSNVSTFDFLEHLYVFSLRALF